MRRYVVIDKKTGETPLAALSAWKAEHPCYADTPASYAGRLDPMASGKLLVLLGEECKRQDRYRGLDKEYDVEVLLGVGSDTGDALGIVNEAKTHARVEKAWIEKVLRNEQGTHERAYPAFSSKTVNGKPLFLHTLEGTAVELPTHQETIRRIQLLGITRVSLKELQERVVEFLTRVPRTNEPSKALGADFRIDAVSTAWNNIFAAGGDIAFSIARIRVVCGSGTYMRTLAARIGNACGTEAIALSIQRRKIGMWWGGVWWKQY